MKPYDKHDGKYTASAVEECLQAALADLRMEGLICTDEEISLMRRYGNGEMTKAEYLSAAVELVRKAAV